MIQIFAKDVLASRVPSVSERTPFGPIDGKKASMHLRTKITLFTYMLTQGGTDRVAAILARGYADAGFDVEIRHGRTNCFRLLSKLPIDMAYIRPVETISPHYQASAIGSARRPYFNGK
jgi:hypothetical protein